MHVETVDIFRCRMKESFQFFCLSDYARSDAAVVLEPVDIAVLSSRNCERLITEHPMPGLKLLKRIFLIVSGRLDISFDRIAKIF